MSGHFIRVEFDAQNEIVDLAFICDAPADGDCHMVCPESCESCSHPRTEQVSYCNPSEFINNHDAVIQTAERQDKLTLPVSLSWNGDTYVWTVLTPEPIDREAVRREMAEEIAAEIDRCADVLVTEADEKGNYLTAAILEKASDIARVAGGLSKQVES